MAIKSWLPILTLAFLYQNEGVKQNVIALQTPSCKSIYNLANKALMGLLFAIYDIYEMFVMFPKIKFVKKRQMSIFTDVSKKNRVILELVKYIFYLED